MSTQEYKHDQEHSEFAEVLRAAKGGPLGAVLPVSITQTFGITMSLASITQQSIATSYLTPNGNDPNANNNNLYVFQTQGPNIPFNQQPIASATAPVGGTPIFPNPNQLFGANPYVIAYSVGPAVTTTVAGKTVTSYPNIGATIFTPEGTGSPLGPPSNSPVSVSSSLGIASVTTQYIIFTWTFPPGVNPTLPTGAGAWIGFWNDTVNPYQTPPTAYSPIGRTTPNGSTAVTGLNLSGSSPYTAALFTSGYSANPAQLTTGNIAYYIYFTTGTAL
jgi:hypothetical protein